MKKIVLLAAGLFFFAAVNAQQVVKPKYNRATNGEVKVDSVRQMLTTKDTAAKKPSAKKPNREAAKKPAGKTEAKRND